MLNILSKVASCICKTHVARKGSLNNIFQDSFNIILSQQFTHDRFYISQQSTHDRSYIYVIMTLQSKATFITKTLDLNSLPHMPILDSTYSAANKN